MNATAVGILVCSSGEKIPLIQTIKHASDRMPTNIKIVCADVNDLALSSFFCDEFWAMKPLDEYSDEYLLFELENRNIKCIIPTRDGELAFWSSKKKFLEEAGITVLVSDQTTLAITMDKLEFANWLYKFGFPYIETWNDLDECTESNLVVKERFAYAPKNTFIGVKKSEIKKLDGKLSEPIFQKYVEGNEISVDVWVESPENIKVSARSRDVIIDGEARVTQIYSNSNLENLVNEMARKLGIEGPSVFQFIEDENGNFFPIECNARIGGASTFSINTKFDSFYLKFCSIFGVEPTNSEVLTKSNIQVRVMKDYYF